jgi:D-amino-acid dehydrogenase
LCCAFELQRHGAEVLVLDRGRCGGGASRGNAGWVVPVLSAPLAAPGVIRQVFAWSLRRDSPVRVKPRLDRDLIRWAAHFVRNSSRTSYLAGLQTKLAFGARTMAHFDDLRQAGVNVEMHRRGLLVVALSDEHLAAAHREVAAAVAAGYKGRVRSLDARAATQLEPALDIGVAGGLLLEDERHVRPETLTDGLVSYLRAKQVEIHEGVEISALRRLPRGRWELSCASGAFRADRIVVAAGPWSGRLLRPLGVRVPLQAARGCSLTAAGRGTRPTRPLKLFEARVACTPFTDAVRISGTFELTGMDSSLDTRRLGWVVRAAIPYLKDWVPDNPELRWAGLRAATPDDLPLIGEVPGCSHLYLATGHGTLGLTLAPSTAAALVPLVLGGDAPGELSPFRPGRFSYR